MCSRVKCRTCGKYTWSGCGAHVEQVLRGIPKEQRCSCDRSARKSGPALSGQGIFASLFGSRNPRS